MEREDIELLKSDTLRREIEENIERNPTDIALDKRLVHPREVASQVKYLQRARKKLPSYYAARAILPSLACPLANRRRSSPFSLAVERLEGSII